MSPPSSPTSQTGPAGAGPGRLLRVLGLGLAGAGLVAACLPWGISSPRLLAVVSDELTRSYGIVLSGGGGMQAALLPFPRLTIAEAGLRAGRADGPVLAERGSLAMQLSLLALLTGRVELEALSLDGATVTLPMAETDRRWAVPLERLVGQVGTGTDSQPTRMTLTRATLTGRDPRDGTIQTLHGVDLGLSAPFWGTGAEISFRGTWKRKEATMRISGIDLAALLAGRASPFAANAAWPSGTMTLTGTASFGQAYDVSGRARMATRSLPETLAWIGGHLALAPLIETAAVEADFKAQGSDLLLPKMTVTVGTNHLEGAGSISFADDRPAIQATLAADALNVAPLAADLIDLLGLDPAGTPTDWSGRPVSLGPLTGGDLDLRLSAASVRIGPVVAEDVASSLIVREGNVEASLGRASLQGGTVKGRIALADTEDRRATDMRAQGVVDGLDLGALLVDLGEERWLIGDVNGTFAVESRAATVGELFGRLGGRAALTVDGGSISGLDLATVVQADRDEPAIQRIGRTEFTRAGASLRFKDGLGTISDGTLKADTVSASLGGTVSLLDRRVEARAELSPRAGNGPARLFEIVGPWRSVIVRAARMPTAAPGSSGLAVMRPDFPHVPANPAIPASARAYAP